MKSLSIIIVDYKTIEKTITYIKSLAASVKNVERIHLIIVDNESKDSLCKIGKAFHFSKDIVLEKQTISCFLFKNMHILYYPSGCNLGYAKGNNLGFNILDKLYHDRIVLISNNDIVFETSLSLDKVEAIFESDESIAAIGPNIVGINGEKQNPYFKPSIFKCAFLIFSFLHNFFHVNIDVDYNCTNDYCYRLMGSFIFFRTDFFKEVGCFDEGTFMYSEEPIISEKLLKIGKRCYYWNDYRVIHEHGYTVKNSFSKIREKEMVYESMIYYLKKYRNVPNMILLLSKFHFYIYLLLYKSFYRFYAFIKKYCELTIIISILYIE